MKWLLKYYIKSKYLGYSKVYYKEFELFSLLEYYIRINNIKDYEIYRKKVIINEIIFSII